jgi:hypothetical protein
MTLDGVEFIRRFLQHVMPSGFVRIRHFGLLANRNREEKLSRCRTLLAESPTAYEPEPVTSDVSEQLKADGDSGEAVSPSSGCCPVCGKGRMVFIEVLPRPNTAQRPMPNLVGDTS